MIAAKIAEATGEPVPMPMVPIEELPFVRDRLALLNADKNDARTAKLSQDRTTSLVRRWKTITDSLPQTRSATMTTLEATEGKGGAVTLRVCDRQKFDALQKTIRDHQEQINALEAAMRELDSQNAGWLDELRNQRDSQAGVENQQRAMLTTWANAALQKGVHSRRTPEQILAGDQIYQDKKAKAEAQIAHARKELDRLIPIIEKIEDILSSVGC